MSFLDLADYIGVFVFAISGGLVAIRHNLDLFGILVLSLLPAIGGGTLRDVLLNEPVFWLFDTTVLLVALAGGVAAVIYKSWTKVRILVWVDALGLALFAVIGTVKAYDLGFGLMICAVMGTITATAGGLIRDVVVGGPPMLLKEDIYAVAALTGSTACWLLLSHDFSSDVALSGGFSVVFVIRAAAIAFKWSLPTSAKIHQILYRK